MIVEMKPFLPKQAQGRKKTICRQKMIFVSGFCVLILKIVFAGYLPLEKDIGLSFLLRQSDAKKCRVFLGYLQLGEGYLSQFSRFFSLK